MLPRPRAVVALGGNALLRRHEAPTWSAQVARVEAAARALVPLAERFDLVLTHGNGPQVGVLALQSEQSAWPYPLDALGAESEGLIGYLLVQALGAVLPGRELVALLTRTTVAADDPAFDHPTKPIGPLYTEAEARRLAGERGWSIAPEPGGWRRVVASPAPVDLVEATTVRRLVEAGTVVVCSGGGGVPVVVHADGRLAGVEAVVDKDLAAGVLARAVGAEALLLLTDVDAVRDGWPDPAAPAIAELPVASAAPLGLPAGSMGPKVDACARFVAAGGRLAAIGRLEDAARVASGLAGTRVVPGSGPVRYRTPVNEEVEV